MMLFSNGRLPIDYVYLKIDGYNVGLKENITYLGPDSETKPSIKLILDFAFVSTLNPTFD